MIRQVYQFLFYLLVIVVISVSCSSYKFAKESVFVDDVDEYFNPTLKMNVWTYMNFYPYRGGNDGVRLKDFYPMDKEVLKKLGIKAKGINILFSAVPNSKPNYHLIALFHETNLPNNVGFERKEVNKKQYYFQKDLEIGRLDVRHVLIPFENNNKMLSLVYYISSELHLDCRFCKLDYLAYINTVNLQDSTQQQYRNNWVIAENLTDQGVALEISVPQPIQKRKEKVLLKVFAEYETETGINYFHILDGKEKTDKITLKLLPNRYFLEYQDEKFNTIYRDTIQVNK
ncbi:hypothetical protein [Sphingobacterium bovistauri]|uniref:Lipoprotein n=1 Tax=Sphingobacterium bovistauri TaxID=2781959 RepID=A0ABS7Z6L3_9SPHI|nr:hypothetical protein [Sphingobacterium bovistauri]MCA5004510.1 hypothetical protein [Sphingobacterium bovistauri]